MSDRAAVLAAYPVEGAASGLECAFSKHRVGFGNPPPMLRPAQRKRQRLEPMAARKQGQAG